MHMKFYFNLFFLCFLLLSSSCINKEYFKVVSIFEHEAMELNQFQRFDFYMNREDVKKDFFEVAILKTDIDYIGNFFFDEDFMQKLEKKIKTIYADGAIYDTTIIFSNKKENYFIAIKFLE